MKTIIRPIACYWCGQGPTYPSSASRWVCSEDCNALLTGTAVGAGMLGIPVRTYRNYVKGGFKYCPGHQTWHPRTAFYKNANRGDGLDSYCKEIARPRSRETMRRLRAERQEAS